MSNILQLNRWVLGDDPRRVFPVEIASSKTAGTLKKAIKDEKMNTFNGIDADPCILSYWYIAIHALVCSRRLLTISTISTSHHYCTTVTHLTKFSFRHLARELVAG
jgi:hypothetical protein